MVTLYIDSVPPMLKRAARGVEGALKYGVFHEATKFETEKHDLGYDYVKSNRTSVRSAKRSFFGFLFPFRARLIHLSEQNVRLFGLSVLFVF